MAFLALERKNMESLVGVILFFFLFLYLYWVAPALALLNWLLGRSLGKHLALVPVVVHNLIVSLLLLAPLRSHSNSFVLSGDYYHPWYFGVQGLNQGTIPWIGLLTLAAGSVMITVATVCIPKLKYRA